LFLLTPEELLSLLINSYNLFKLAKKYSHTLWGPASALLTSAFSNPALPCCAHFLSDPATWLEHLVPRVTIHSQEPLAGCDPGCVMAARRERAKTGANKVQTKIQEHYNKEAKDGK